MLRDLLVFIQLRKEAIKSKLNARATDACLLHGGNVFMRCLQHSFLSKFKSDAITIRYDLRTITRYYFYLKFSQDVIFLSNFNNKPRQKTIFVSNDIENSPIRSRTSHHCSRDVCVPRSLICKYAMIRNSNCITFSLLCTS